METPLETFEPSTYGVDLLTIIFLSITLLFAILLYFQNKRKVPYYEKKRKGLYSMLLSFGILIFGATTILNWWSSLNLKTVKFYSSSIETPQGIVKYDDIRAAYIYVDKPTLINQPQNKENNKETKKDKRMLILEEYDRKTHVLAEENYPIEDILKTLNEMRKKE